MIGLFMPMLSVAQDASPAPELKDFKLDKPAQTNPGPVDPEPSTAKPAPEAVKLPANAPKPIVTEPKPQPAPNIEVPKKAATASDKPKSNRDDRATAPVNPPTERSREEATKEPQEAKPNPEAEPALPSADTIDEPITTDAPTIAKDSINADKPALALSSDPIVPGLIGAGIVGLLILLGWLWTRRNRPAEEITDLEIVAEPEVAQAIEVDRIEDNKEQNIRPLLQEPADNIPLNTINPEAPTIAAIPASGPVLPKALAKAPISFVDLAFTPDRVVISFNSMTLYGDLAIYNRGKSPAFDVQLHTALISANENQHDEINAFLANGHDTQAELLYDIEPGEKINLALSLVLPLVEVKRFALGSQMLAVPILLARLDYRTNKNKASLRTVETVSCLIGREASPPQPKMGPLRLDLGARSYTGLGQRSLGA